MKHAGVDALDVLEPLLRKIRKYTQLKEKRRGLFYRRGSSFLHFHEDPNGLFADLSSGGDFWRLRVSERAEQTALLAKIAEVLGDEDEGVSTSTPVA